ncbi:MAG: CDP-glycerol glycerophosphotransferase family protein [Alteromonadaceae bacterium]|nr:CDP-glycerol glycerophosphotransferase family protein [Alteromonadaceae bacterium]
MKVYFDIQHLYYVPQYLPVKDELTARGIECLFILYKQDLLDDVLINYINANKLAYQCVESCEQARELYIEQRPDWIIFGNAFKEIEAINKHSKTALMEHGIGPKACYYDVSKCDITFRFVEGQHRLKRLQQRFPEKVFIDTGYAKLDPIINGTLKRLDLTELGLKADKPTILYAPTFYPSSIECFPKNFPSLLSQYNIIIKPHFFSLVKQKYRKQQTLFNAWKKYDNVFLADINHVSILPFLESASLIISDTSSTLFEFTALNKPAIWCDFYKVRWSYRGIFKRRLKNRLDDDLKYFAQVAQQVKNFKELKEQINVQLNNPELKEKARLNMTEILTGKVDGQCSRRIVDFIIPNPLNK